MLAFGRTTGCIVGCTTQASGESVSSSGYHQIISPKNETDELHLIHNLAIFNQRFLHPPLKKLIFQDLKTVVLPGEWLVLLNPRDANRHFIIHNDHHRFLQSFKVHYEWKGLLLNMSVAPWLFTRITLPASSFLHSRNIYFYPYLGNYLTKSHYWLKLKKQVNFIPELLSVLGWIINTEKSQNQHRICSLSGISFV